MSFIPRRKEISLYLDAREAYILEIGALDDPTYTRPEFNIKYLDFASADELTKAASDNPRYARNKIVDVDYVSPTPEYSQHTSEKFNLVIANHVIEHIPDTIRWLTEIYNILSPGGILFLSVPDKRYTFDIARQLTDIIDLIKNHREQVERPDFYHILRHFYFHKDVSAGEAWEKQYGDKINRMRFDLKTAIGVAERYTADSYADVHCHVFTCDSFKEICEDLIDSGFLQMKLENVTQTLHMSNEFYAVLSKPNEKETDFIR